MTSRAATTLTSSTRALGDNFTVGTSYGDRDWKLKAAANLLNVLHFLTTYLLFFIYNLFLFCLSIYYLF